MWGADVLPQNALGMSPTGDELHAHIALGKYVCVCSV